MQIMAPVMCDDRMYRVAGALESALVSSWGGLLLDKAPRL